jgi:hypothetical protein
MPSATSTVTPAKIMTDFQRFRCFGCVDNALVSWAVTPSSRGGAECPPPSAGGTSERAAVLGMRLGCGACSGDRVVDGVAACAESVVGPDARAVCLVGIGDRCAGGFGFAVPYAAACASAAS